MLIKTHGIFLNPNRWCVGVIDTLEATTNVLGPWGSIVCESFRWAGKLICTRKETIIHDSAKQRFPKSTDKMRQHIK